MENMPQISEFSSALVSFADLAAKLRMFLTPGECMKNRLLFIVCLFAPTVVHADTFLVTQSGNQCGTGPISIACGLPGNTWTYSFLTDSNPTPVSSSTGFNFEAAISDFAFYIDGVLQTLTTTPTLVTWFNAVDDGGLEILDPSFRLIVTEGAQLYTNGETNPVMTPGEYVFITEKIPGISTPAWFPLSITPVPEPSTWGLLLIVIGLLGLMRRRLVPASREGHFKNHWSADAEGSVTASD